MRNGSRVLQALQPWGDVWMRSGWRVQANCQTGEARVLDPTGHSAKTGSEAACLDFARHAAPMNFGRRAVVLLHGLGHHPGATVTLAKTLAGQGWVVGNVAYPSLRAPIEVHARAASRIAAAFTQDGVESVSLVGHSLGGLVARAAMARAAADGWRPGRLVLIGSPARGSGIAHLLRDLGPYRSLTGACGQSVTPAGAASVPPPSCREVGVIAGGNGKRGYNPLLPGDNDGVVTVAETRLPDHETAFLRVPSLHTPLAGHAETVAAASRFVDCGNLAV